LLHIHKDQNVLFPRVQTLYARRRVFHCVQFLKNVINRNSRTQVKMMMMMIIIIIINDNNPNTHSLLTIIFSLERDCIRFEFLYQKWVELYKIDCCEWDEEVVPWSFDYRQQEPKEALNSPDIQVQNKVSIDLFATKTEKKWSCD
jgi:hypothetical protein